MSVGRVLVAALIPTKKVGLTYPTVLLIFVSKPPRGAGQPETRRRDRTDMSFQLSRIEGSRTAAHEPAAPLSEFLSALKEAGIGDRFDIESLIDRVATRREDRP